MTKLIEDTVRKLPSPEDGYFIAWDSELKGFGVRVNSGGAKVFVFNYRTQGGTQRRIKIGPWPGLSVKVARERAEKMVAAVHDGRDPQAARQADRQAPVFANLAAHYIAEHLPNRRKNTDEDTIRIELLPVLGQLKVAEIALKDIRSIHRSITKRGKRIRANRVVALMSTMFAMAVDEGWCSSNPCKGVKKNEETARERYATTEELPRLTKALDEYHDQRAADAIRLLLYTGARTGEVLGARWDQFDFSKGTWSKPASGTKQKKPHVVPLSPPALLILEKMRADRVKAPISPFVFPGRDGKGHRVDLKKPWAAICRSAGITGLRVHDLRHSFASILVALGYTLPMIGKLLGHAHTSTTQRYAHLDVGPLRELVAKVGAVVDGADKVAGKIVKLPRRSR